MLNNKKAVIFDLDGTLIDSMWMWRDIDIEFLGRYGIELPVDLQSSIEGMSFSETAMYFKERFEIPESVDWIKEEWNRMAKDIYTNKIPLKEGTKEFLQFLKNKGMKMGIATSNSIELVTIVTEKLGIREYFDEIHTSCEVKQGKPAPDIYLYVAKTLDVKPEQCLVFEDVIQGIMAGKNAGMEVCAVWDSYSEDITVQKQECADYYIHSYLDIEME